MKSIRPDASLHQPIVIVDEPGKRNITLIGNTHFITVSDIFMYATARIDVI